jgi:S1-C subfamily serine protease
VSRGPSRCVEGWIATGVVVLLLAGVSTGCAAESPPPEAKRPPLPILVEPDPEIATLAGVKPPAIALESAERQARRLTLRVRNIGCEGIATGSGWALSSHLLVTNRHVLAGADQLELNTWNGEDLQIDAAKVGRLADLGIVHVSSRLPQVGKLGGKVVSGDRVTAVGYPEGGELRMLPGVVVDHVEGSKFGVPRSVIRLNAKVRPGNSGGPLLDRDGKIVGVIFAREIATGLALAIPVTTLKALIHSGDYSPVPPCGSE